MPSAKNYDDLAFNPMFKNLKTMADKNSVSTAMMSVSIISLCMNLLYIILLYTIYLLGCC